MLIIAIKMPWHYVDGETHEKTKWGWILHPKPPLHWVCHAKTIECGMDLTQTTSEDIVMKNKYLHNNALAFIWVQSKNPSNTKVNPSVALVIGPVVAI
jgi:hypothetical protein